MIADLHVFMLTLDYIVLGNTLKVCFPSKKLYVSPHLLAILYLLEALFVVIS